MAETSGDFVPRPLGAWRDFYRSNRGVLHSTPITCPALEDMRERIGSDKFTTSLRAGETFNRVRIKREDYLTNDWGRVCRKCAWEPLMMVMLAAPGETADVAFSTIDPTRPTKDTWSATSNARLSRVAWSINLPTVSTPAGLVAYGPVPQAALGFMEVNTTLFRLESASLNASASPDVLVIAWSLWLDKMAGVKKPDQGTRSHAFTQAADHAQIVVF